ncbi:hypothetical protein Tco_0968761 [Tanacetum coccineum]
MEYLNQTEKELKINFNKPFKEQDPLNKLNNLTNKKRKRTDELKDHSTSTKKHKSSLQHKEEDRDLDFRILRICDTAKQKRSGSYIGYFDDIYSAVDACSTAMEMWLSIERLQQGESINKQDVKTKLFWEFGKFTSSDGNQLFDILKQHQNEVNEIHAKKIARNANPLALIVVAAQHHPDNYSPNTYYQAPKPHITHTSSLRHKTSTRSHATTENKSKEIAKQITPPSESASEEDSDPEQAQRDNDMQKNLALIAKYIKNIYKPTKNNHRTSSNTRNKTVDTSSRSGNDRKTGQFGNEITEYGHFAKERRKAKRGKDYEYHKEKMMLCKQDLKGVPLSTEQEDWLHDTNDEPDEQESEAHYMYMEKIQEVPTTDSGPTYDVEPLEKVHLADNYNVFATNRQHSEQPESINDTYVVETVDSNVTPDSLDMCDNEEQVDQNDEELEDERVLLTSLIANFKLDIDENKKSQKQLKKENTSLTQDLNELEKYKILQTNHKDKEKAELEYAKALGLLEETKRLHNKSVKTQSYTTFCVKEENAKLVNQISAHESKISQMLKEKEQMKKDFKER